MKTIVFPRPAFLTILLLYYRVFVLGLIILIILIQIIVKTEIVRL